MPKLTPKNPEDLELLQTNPALGDSTIPPDLIKLTLDHEETLKLSAGGKETGSVKLAGSASAGFAIVNDPKDPNHGGFFSEKGDDQKPDPAAMLELPAVVPRDAQSAYVVVQSFAVAGKIAGKGSFAGLDADASAGGSAEAWLCRRFDRDTPLRTAVDQTLDEHKTVFSVTELQSMHPDEVLACGMTSDLSLGLEFSWTSLADALGSALNAAAGNLGPLHFAFSATASISAKVEATTALRLFARRSPRANHVRFDVRKASGRHLVWAASLGVKAKLPQLADFKQELNDLFGQVAGLPKELVAKLADAAHVDAFSANEKKLFDAAVKQLKLEDPKIEAWQTLKQMIEAVKQDLDKKLPDTIALAFKYTWDRLTERSAIAAFDVPYAALRDLHPTILALDLATLRHSDAVIFESYLGKTVEALTIGYGFGLRAGDFVFSDRTETSRRWITLENLAGAEQKSFLGARRYATQWMDEKTEQVVELSADSNGFHAPLHPADFPVGLAVTFQWKNQKLGDHAAQAADDAQLAGLLADADPTDLTAVLGAGTDPKQVGDTTVTFKVPPAATPALLAELSHHGRALLPHALALALPGTGKPGRYPERRKWDLRRKTYAPLFAAYLNAPFLADDHRIDQMATSLLRRVTPELYTFEKYNANDPDQRPVWTVGSLLRRIDTNYQGRNFLLDRSNKVLAALRSLHERNLPGVTLDVFPQALSLASPFWSERLTIRAFVALLGLAADRLPAGRSMLEAKLTFNWTANGEKHQVLHTL